MFEILLSGGSGAMGRAIRALADTEPDLAVTAEARRDTPFPDDAAGDVVVDFSVPEQTLACVEYCLARLASAGETRANLAAGGGYRGQPLSERDRWICAQVAPKLAEHGLTFVGLDVIGDYLTEVNVTSPTCIREIARETGVNAADRLLDAIERRLAPR